MAGQTVCLLEVWGLVGADAESCVANHSHESSRTSEKKRVEYIDVRCNIESLDLEFRSPELLTQKESLDFEEPVGGLT